MPERKTGAFRFIALAGLEPADPDRPFLAADLATSDEPERQVKLPGGGLAGAAEDPALLSYAGLKRETPDRPQPGVPQVLSEGVCKLTTEIRATYQKRSAAGLDLARKGHR